jgi:putative GTP pyrophosphokinase
MDANSILSEYDSRRVVFNNFAERMSDLLRQILAGFEIRIQSIEKRVKTRESLQDKLARAGTAYVCLDDVTDICGLRIITYFAADVDKVAELLRREFEIDPVNSTDKRIFDDPDRFGYQSLHYIVTLKPARTALAEYSAFKCYRAEVQVRTVIQHAWAEIEHDLGYKTQVAVPAEVKRRLFRLAAILELADDEFTAIEQTRGQYRQRVKQQLKIDVSSVSVDATSIAEFVKSDSLLIGIEQEIATKTERELVTINDSAAARLATWLKYVGFKTINEVQADLERFHHEIVRVAVKRIVRRRDDAIGSGVSLLYLCHAVLTDGADSTRLLKFLRDNNFGPEEQLETVATELYDAFHQE